MFKLIGPVYALIALSTWVEGSDIVSLAQSTELRQSNGTVVPRVTRDPDGNVTGLRLDGLELSPEHVEQIASLEHLRRLVLFRTNVSDQDLVRLEKCQSLEFINLSGTEVTDSSIDSILKFSNLRSLCLGNVRITPEAVQRLKERNQTRESSDEQLRWGYSQRRD